MPKLQEERIRAPLFLLKISSEQLSARKLSIFSLHFIKYVIY